MTTGDWIVRDTDYCHASIDEIGGKAKGLGAILQQSAPCPPSFCVTTSALRQCFRAEASAQTRPEDVPDIVLRLGLPPDLIEEISTQAMTLFADANGRLSLAVRSSFVSEDTPEAISPGVYRSEVGLTSTEDVCAAILRVWASAFTAEAIAYRRSLRLPLYELGMAVIVQHAPTPVTGGVVYTLLPNTNDPTALLIEFAEGSPVNVVENRVRVGTCVVNKRVRTIDGLSEGPLQASQANELVAWSLKLERAYNSPLDLEWLVDQRSTLWLLQARRLPFAVAPTPPGQFVTEARGTTLRSTKLVPFQLAREASVNTIPASLILPAAFETFKRNGGEAPSDLVADCRSLFQIYISRGPVSVRSAYWSALDSGDLMPQSGSLTTVDDCMAHLVNFWHFISREGRDDYTAEVALLVCNWTDLRASVIATVPTAADNAVAVVSALYGQLDGLEACAHDVYEIELQTLTLRREMVPQKQHAVRIPGCPPEAVPVEVRGVPVLDADELRSVGRNLSAIGSVFGAARVEFLILNGKGSADDRVVTWQVSPLTPAEAELQYFRVIPIGESGPEAVAVGGLVSIRGLKDIRLLLNQSTKRLAYIDFTHSNFRDTGLANAIAADLKRAGYPVLLKGSLLSHFAALLRDYGVTVYPILESLDDVSTTSPVAVVPLA